MEPRRSEDPLVRRPPPRDLSYLFIAVVIVPMLSIIFLGFEASGNSVAYALFFSPEKLVIRLAFATSAALAVASGLVAFTRPARVQLLAERWGSPTNFGAACLVYGAGLAGFALVFH